MSLFPWRPRCGCLLDDVDGEVTLVEACARHDGCRLVVVDAGYPAVTSGCEPFCGPAGTSGAPDAHVTNQGGCNGVTSQDHTGGGQ